MAKRMTRHVSLSTQQPWDDPNGGKVNVRFIKTPTQAKHKLISYFVRPGSPSYKRILSAMLKFVGFEGKADDQSGCAYCGTKNPGDPCRKCGAPQG